VSILTTLWFHPLKLNLDNQQLMIQTSLNKPVTSEIQRLVETGLRFEIVYVISLIKNKKKIEHIEVRKRLSYVDDRYFLNDTFIPQAQLQDVMGEIDVLLDEIQLNPKDTLQVIIKGIISESTDFEQATQLKVATLWNYHQPIIKKKYRFDGINLIELYDR